MPKTNDATGATYQGYEGVVEHAGGRASTRYEEEALRGLSQLDPSRRVNGEVVEGFESDERQIEPREGSVAADFSEVKPIDDGQSDQEDGQANDSDSNTEQKDNRDESPSEDSPKESEGGEQSSDGSSSTTSSRSSATATKASRAKSR
jgi:hypothetical protein